MAATRWTAGALACLALAACEQRAVPGESGASRASAHHPEAAPAPDSIEAARRMLQRFIADGADTRALTSELAPRDEDYQAAFVGDLREQARAAFRGPFENGHIHVAPRPGQTELRVWAATTEQLRDGSAHAVFSPAYRRIADRLRPRTTWLRFEFRRPNETVGLAYEALVHVNGRWVLFPKPWRALR